MKTKVFGSTGLRVSELVLGTGNFGTGWGYGSDREEASKIFNAYADVGGNFLDTADFYQFGQSEEILGDLLTGRREDFLLTSKFTLGDQKGLGTLRTGNSRKSMVSSVEASLRRLKTDRIDIYWAHYADGVTPSEEIVRGFDDLARAGKILYGGLSNFPAWRVTRAATLAELGRAAKIAGIQVEHSLVHRSPERELFPAAAALGMGIVTYSPLAGGMLTGKYRKGEGGRELGLGGRAFRAENSAEKAAVVDVLLEMASELETTPDKIAIAWVATKGGIPMVGPRTLDQLKSNLRSLELILNDEQISKLDKVSHGMLNDEREALQGVAGRVDAPAVHVA
ncbi:aldo/keto reductase [Rhizobium sp. BE258]|uniref:aldo/keto reductase n=1 Tax=Rhizobium sp. BE258 TaxID=2817722 RepID=UPI000DDA778D|nr:aldo/keto reductase [Rhizobium sp. BE258]MDR7144984.1 aryl-alcohol dehydrogenase-like predicted oxidoreductase [Rhizobium sp. BE258]